VYHPTHHILVSEVGFVGFETRHASREVQRVSENKEMDLVERYAPPKRKKKLRMQQEPIM
jgi:hypothetical protein